jgi:hypothetical protein
MRWSTRLLPADPARVNAEHRPRLPDWFPLPNAKVLRKDPDDETSVDNSPENRARVRWQTAQQAACEGPHDGTHPVVEHAGSTPPPRLILDAGGTVYTRSDHESNKHVVTYRYSPGDSPSHGAYMRAVEDAYAEFGRTYAEEARHDDPQHHGVHVTVPTDGRPPSLF